MIKRKLHIILFFSMMLIMLSANVLAEKFTNKNKFICLTTKQNFVAGEGVSLEFKGNFKIKPQLFIIHSLGKVLLNGTIKNDKIQYTLPKIYSNKSGFVSWFFIENGEEKLKGNFQISQNDKTKTQLESYLASKSTIAGDKNFVMFISIPTDDFDNPKPDNTDVAIKNQFLNTISTENIKSKDLIAWTRILTPKKSGIVLISASCNNTFSKEFDAVIYPSIPTNFTISYQRNHEFSDGNQITKFKTSILKDKYGNIISDGTLVTFIIKNKQNTILKTFGTSVEGIATGQILHPEEENNYSVTAYINGIAKSNTIQIPYKSINPTIEFTISKDQRTITVGPIKSFMNQLVPDGIKVNLKIFHKNQLIEILTENSSKGKAEFYLSPEFYKEKDYQFEIETLGKTQKTF